MQIIISDDCSSDRTFEIIKETVNDYSGPHEIIINRNESNFGIGSHVNRVMELSSGDYIVAAAGDDISLPERTSVLVDYFIANKICNSLFSNMIVIDAEGNKRSSWAENGWAPSDQTLKQRCLDGVTSVFGCTHAWRKSVFDFFGKLDSRVVHEDMAIPFRSALLGTVNYIDKSLVYYRRHDDNVYNTFDREIPDKRKRIMHACGRIGVRTTMLADFMKYIALPGNLNKNYHDEIAALEEGIFFAKVEYELLTCLTLVREIKALSKCMRSRRGIKLGIRFLAMKYFQDLYIWRLQAKLYLNRR